MATPPRPYRSLGATTELPDDELNRYYLADLGHHVAVTRVRGRLYAFAAHCTCSDELLALAWGWHAGTRIMCRHHRSQFDVTNGMVLEGPATRAIDTYEVREHDGEIQVRI